MDNPEKLATQGTQDEEKQNKNTTQYVIDTIIRKQTQITQIRHEPALPLTTGGKDEPNIVYMRDLRKTKLITYTMH